VIVIVDYQALRRYLHRSLRARTRWIETVGRIAVGIVVGTAVDSEIAAAVAVAPVYVYR
jgi:hypothetical protein